MDPDTQTPVELVSWACGRHKDFSNTDLAWEVWDGASG